VSIFDQFAGQLVNINITMPTREEITLACRHVLYHLDGDREIGQEPGGFTIRIIEAACHADEENMAKLALGFSALVTTVDMYKNKPGGVDVIRRLASKTPVVQPDDGFSPKGN
jgi:hypothetical protein